MLTYVRGVREQLTYMEQRPVDVQGGQRSVDVRERGQRAVDVHGTEIC